MIKLYLNFLSFEKYLVNIQNVVQNQESASEIQQC